jgi:hypothetical protein
LSPLLANIALSVLDEHAHRPWLTGGVMSTPRRRARRRAKGLPNWRIVRYADLCRGRHKSAYAESRVMPTALLDGLPGGQVVAAGRHNPVGAGGG